MGDLEAFGGEVPDEFLQELQGEEAACEVEPENWTTVMAWMRVQTQWRTGMAGLIGLDYCAVDVALRRARIEDPEGQVFEGLQVMEGAVLQALQKG